MTIKPSPPPLTINMQRVTAEEPELGDIPGRRAGSVRQREQHQQLCKVIMKNLVERYPSNRMPLYFSGINTVVGRSIRLTSKGIDGYITGRRAGIATLDQRATRTTKHSTSGPSLVGRGAFTDDSSTTGHHNVGKVTRKYPLARRGVNRGLIHIQKAPIHQPFPSRFVDR